MIKRNLCEQSKGWEMFNDNYQECYDYVGKGMVLHRKCTQEVAPLPFFCPKALSLKANQEGIVHDQKM